MGEVVVLDANALIADPWLQGHALRALLAASRRHQFAVAVPEIALWEAVNDYRERVQAAVTGLEKARTTFRKLHLEMLDESPSSQLSATIVISMLSASAGVSVRPKQGP